MSAMLYPMLAFDLLDDNLIDNDDGLVEPGPWVAQVNTAGEVEIVCQNSTADALLTLKGVFFDARERLEYGQQLAQMLNERLESMRH